MLVADRDYVKGKYDLTKLKAVEDLVAAAVEINVPFNNYVTGFCAFTHKAGIHAKAILANPTTYGSYFPSPLLKPTRSPETISREFRAPLKAQC